MNLIGCVDFGITLSLSISRTSFRNNSTALFWLIAGAEDRLNETLALLVTFLEVIDIVKEEDGAV